VWTLDKKTALHYVNLPKLHDVYSLEYLSTGDITDVESFETPVHRHMYQKFDSFKNINKSIPIVQHLSFAKRVFTHIKNIKSSSMELFTETSYKFMDEIAIPALHKLESNGIHIDPEQIIERYGERIERHITKDDLVYSSYNLYTTTGRCSNKFAGINFAALNKKDGQRAAYTSRFENGTMLMMDYESFHLRLIGDMIEFELPTNQVVHEYFAKQYFKTDELTEEQYNEGKQITFQLLYGESRPTDAPEFFQKVYQYIDMLMVLLNSQGYIQSPYFKRKIYKDRIEDITPAKVFNYMIQLAETERNLKIMLECQNKFTDIKTLPVLYTYDSILFDYCMDDGSAPAIEMLSILTENGKFPMRVYYGSTYDDLKKLEIISP
jgi:hypothetical protein